MAEEEKELDEGELYDRWLETGEKLKLEGEALINFVEKKVKEVLDRKDRLEARNISREKDAQEHELKLKEYDSKTEEDNKRHELKLREYEERQIQIENEEKEKERRHQFELEQARIATSSGSTSSPPVHVVAPKGPKLPHFDDEKDNMDMYLRRFERYALINKWDRSYYASYLSTLLRGKALDVYSQLTPTESDDYDKLKNALLKRFQLTEEGFRRKFHGIRMGETEMASQFMVKLADTFDRWTEMADVGNQHADLRQFIIVEQFIHAVPDEVSVYLRERGERQIEQVIKIAEAYMEAHKIYKKVPHRSERNRNGAKSGSNNDNGITGNNQSYSRKPPSTTSQEQSNKQGIKCWLCNEYGHKTYNCPKKRKAIAAVRIQDETDEDDSHDEVASVTTVMNVSEMHHCKPRLKSVIASARIPTIGNSHILHEDQRAMKNLPTCKGKANNKDVTVLRDTGCTSAVARRSIVSESQLTGKTIRYISVDKTTRSAPEGIIDLECPMYTGKLKAILLDDPLCDIILGNLKEITNQPSDILYGRGDEDDDSKKRNQSKRAVITPKNDEILVVHKNKEQTRGTQGNNEKGKPKKSKVKCSHDLEIVQQVETRGSIQRGLAKSKPLKIDGIGYLGTHDEFKEEQDKDASLFQCRKWAELKKVSQSEDGKTVSYIKEKGLIYRVTTKENIPYGERQLMVPKRYRNEVIKLAHENILAGHMGINKTVDRVRSQFYWPGVHDDISRYVKSCDQCQRTVPKGRIPKAPLDKMPVIKTPFYRVAVDIVGPINPSSARGHRYILTLVDMATRYPKAKALKKIDSESVADALLSMFSDTGIPNEILTDNGSQFKSEMIKEVFRLMSLRSINTTPYHAQCNGLCERFNGTLKHMLKKMVVDQPREWDRFIDPLLFAYREVPSASMGGFSPFELMCGRPLRGPMAILREIWANGEIDEGVYDTYEYVLDLRNRLEQTCQLASEALAEAQECQKAYFDKRAKPRDLKEEDEVLLLLPTDNNKLLMKWKGPFLIKKRVGKYNYAVEIGNNVKVFHINMLKQYHRRNKTEETATIATVVYESDEEGNAEQPVEIVQMERIPKVETWKDANINPELSVSQKNDLKALMGKYQDVFSSIPGTTNLIEHRIELTESKPVRSTPYPIPFAMHDKVKDEIDDMLKIGIIEPSVSPYSSPLVIIKKKDGSIRPVQDMRKINKITKYDCESVPNPDQIYAKLAGKRYLSKFDFCKGYWQIPMSEQSKEITAFSTPFGHYQFLKMPFGLVNSGQTYAKMMRMLLDGMDDIDNFVDDVLQHTYTWEKLMTDMEEFFRRLEKTGLKVKPSKCFLGYTDIGFVGHRITDGKLLTLDENTEKVRKAEVPKTKKQLRSLLGLTGYYRKFIPNYSDKVKILTDLTKANSPENLVWNENHQKVFESIKEELCADPVLKIVDLEKKFVLRTDASATGLGAVLMQEHNSTLHPVAYASRKLLPRERNYATIEKECLAVVWAIDKFKVYLMGKKFKVQTDHQSLSYMNRTKYTNSRVMRWAMALQPYDYDIEYIKGNENVGADFMSRHMEE